MQQSRFLNTQNTISYRRELREKGTDAEKILWSHLRNRRLGGLKFRRQHSIGTYIVDFLHVDTNTIIELDGDVHFSLEKQMEKDKVRQQWLESNGFKVVRYNNNDIFNNLDCILDEIYHNLTNSWPDLTLPSPHRRGDRTNLTSLKNKIEACASS